jgi:hypothetical protein
VNPARAGRIVKVCRFIGLKYRPENSTMRNSRRKLFISATISGIALRLGLPGLADLLNLFWNTIQGPLTRLTPSGLEIIVSLVSLAVFIIATYLTWEIYLKGAKKGKKGLLIVITGVISGFVLGSLLLVIVADTLASL